MTTTFPTLLHPPPPPSQPFDTIDDKYSHLLPKPPLAWQKWLTIITFATISALLTSAFTFFVINYILLEISLYSSHSPSYPHPAKVPPTLLAGSTISHNDTTPVTPRIRDMDEYIIDPLWPYDAPPVIREYHWTIHDANLNPDGVYRPMILINNQFPGPLVQVNQGDRIILHLDNQAANATAIHFHGMFQNGTNHMDGTVGITQCPIAPGSHYTYNFTVQGQSGTYWYHAHHSAQASDGLFGPMVVHAKTERTNLQKLPYTTDRVLMFHDHYQDTTSSLLMDYLSPGRENEEPVPDSALLNGRGVRSCAEFPHRRCNDSALSFPEIRLARGESHRLRILNTGAFATFQVQVDEHAFWVTEVDGTDVFPEEFHRLEIMPAQRYSIIVEANKTGGDVFWLRGRFVTHCFRRDNDYMKPNIEGIIRYVDSPTDISRVEPTSKDWEETIQVVCKDLNSSMLHPVVQPVIPNSNGLIHLKAAFHIGDWTLARGFMNQSTWRINVSAPSLHRMLDAPVIDRLLQDDFVDNGVNDWLFETDKELVFQTRGVQTLDIAINNFDDGAHPFHLHGHKFWVLAESSLGYPPKGPDLDDFLERTGALENPVMRDTVTVQSYQWVLIRVTLDNPGMWAFHCHNMWHAESGMVMQFLVMAEEAAVGSGVGEVEREMCRREGIDKGMRPSDDIWEGSF